MTDISRLKINYENGNIFFVKQKDDFLKNIFPCDRFSVKAFRRSFLVSNLSACQILFYDENLDRWESHQLLKQESSVLKDFASKLYTNEIFIFQEIGPTFEKRQIAVDPRTLVRNEFILRQEKHPITISNYDRNTYKYVVFQQHFYSFRIPMKLISFSDRPILHLAEYEHFLLRKGFIISHFEGKLEQKENVYEFLMEKCQTKLKKVSLMFEHSSFFLEYMKVRKEFPLITDVILHNVIDPDAIIDYFSSLTDEVIEISNWNIVIINQKGNQVSKTLRKLIPIFREKKRVNDIFYIEYDLEKQGNFESLITSYLI